jgi:GNAT superfamily N-acetyltransferase
MTAAIGPHSEFRGRLRRAAQDLWLMFREQGPKAALVDIRDMVRNRLYVTNDVLIVKRELGGTEPPPAGAAVRLEAADMGRLPLLAEFNRRQSNTRRTHGFQTYLAAGERPLLALMGDELIGYFWWMDARRAARGYFLDRFGITLRDEEVYGYEFVVAPEHRAGGTAAAFLSMAHAELSRLGYARIYGCVESSNLPARWLYSIQGYETIRRSKTHTILGRLLLVDGTVFVMAGNGVRPLRTNIAAGGH